MIRTFASIKQEQVVYCTHFAVNEIRDFHIGRVFFYFKGHTHSADCLQFSSDSQYLASGAWDCRTILWDVMVGDIVGIEEKKI